MIGDSLVRQIHAARLIGNPGSGVFSLVGPFQLAGDIGDAEEVDHSSDFSDWPEIGRCRDHSGHQREVPARGCSRRNNSLGIHLVPGGMCGEPLRRLQDIIHRGGRRRHLRQPVFDVGHHKTMLDEGQGIALHHFLFIALYPSAAVDEDHARTVSERGCGRLQNIQNGLGVMGVADVAVDLIIRRERERGENERQQETKKALH